MSDNDDIRHGLLIVSGLSGSGKTIALNALEDLGYYCIDNLPAVLLPQFAERIIKSPDAASELKIAISIDSRNRYFLASLPASLAGLQNLGIDYRIIFLEADEKALVKRFSETRRKHPLTDGDTPLLDGIRMETDLLAPLAENAVRRIDTSLTTPHELRRLMRDIAGIEGFRGPVLLFESFGYKHGTPTDADFVFDVRCLPNPHWQEELKPLTGQDPAVRTFLDQQPAVADMVTCIRDFIQRWLPDFERENRSYITVAIGCTGGRHRSVYIVERLHQHFATLDVHVQVVHRELSIA
ncbi:MAG: nucleotide-binding protein [marine bacterium B5-7]|nr:MAG: nucleotide-binding protein [marine bacterium B5-7]